MAKHPVYLYGCMRYVHAVRRLQKDNTIYVPWGPWRDASLHFLVLPFLLAHQSRIVRAHVRFSFSSAFAGIDRFHLLVRYEKLGERKSGIRRSSK